MISKEDKKKIKELKKIQKYFQKLKKAQNKYKEFFLDKEILFVYKNGNNLEEILVEFKKNNFLHLTGIKFSSGGDSNRKNPRKFYNDVETNNISLTKENFNNFTYIKLNKLHELDKIILNSSCVYIIDSQKGKIVSLTSDYFITENNKGKSCLMLGIEKKGNKPYYPKSFLNTVPETKGKFIGEVLIVGYREIVSKKTEKFKILSGQENIDKVTEVIKNKFYENNKSVSLKEGIKDLVKKISNKELPRGNYNALTGNEIITPNHTSGDKRWLTTQDTKKNSITVKENEQPILSIITYQEEEKLYAKPIEYYNVSQLEITKEMEQQFKPMKEKVVEKSQEKGQGIGD